MSRSATARNAPVGVTVVLIALGLIFAALGVLYLAKTAGQLPAFLPGHQTGSGHHHTKHALAAFALAVIFLGGGWFTTGKRTRSTAS